MGSSKAGSDDSDTISDDHGATTETDATETKADAADKSTAFQEGEKVLAFHSQRLYPAKVQKVNFEVKERRYLVHYIGWKKNWDEWVGTDRLLKYTEENLQKQHELAKKDGFEKSAKPGRTQMKQKHFSVGRVKKRKNDFVDKEKGTPSLEKHGNIHIPLALKKQLVDDSESVTHLGKLVKLPRSPNVNEILDKYLEYQAKKDRSIAESVAEVINGLRCYFDKALPAMLLYKNERKQYQEAVGDNVTPSSVYGVEHLLRLFVKLPEILYNADLEETTFTELQQRLLDFLRFLQKNQGAFFLSACQSSGDTSKEDTDK